jgi:hypothetical protein
MLHIPRAQNCAPRRRFWLIFPRIPEYYAGFRDFAGLRGTALQSSMPILAADRL